MVGLSLEQVEILFATDEIKAPNLLPLNVSIIIMTTKRRMMWNVILLVVMLVITSLA